MQTEKKCFRSGSEYNLHKHHIYEGPNRKHSEKHGFWVWLRADWHNMSSYGVHFNREFDLELKERCQRQFEKTNTREEFMAIIGRNYLD